MNSAVTLTDHDQIRAMTLNRVLAGALTGGEAAAQRGLSLRQVRRLLAAYRVEGAAALPHGNRGRPPSHTVAAAVRARVVALSRTTDAGTNDRHFCALLAEREGIVRSPSPVRRIRRAAEEASPRQRRPPAHRQRRERRPREGMLRQLEGSPHAWLAERGPRLTLLAAIDEATGTIAGAVWRAQEDRLGAAAGAGARDLCGRHSRGPAAPGRHPQRLARGAGAGLAARAGRCAGAAGGPPPPPPPLLTSTPRTGPIWRPLRHRRRGRHHRPSPGNRRPTTAGEPALR